jgi:hypothetical protein
LVDYALKSKGNPLWHATAGCQNQEENISKSIAVGFYLLEGWQYILSILGIGPKVRATMPDRSDDVEEARDGSFQSTLPGDRTFSNVCCVSVSVITELCHCNRFPFVKFCEGKCARF